MTNQNNSSCNHLRPEKHFRAIWKVISCSTKPEELACSPNDVNVHRVDLYRSLQFYAGCLQPDGPVCRLVALPKNHKLQEEFLIFEQGYNRAIVAYRAIVQILSSFYPLIKKRSYNQKIARDLGILLTRFLVASEHDLLEKKLKADLQNLLALATGKITDRSCIKLFPGFIRRLLLTECNYGKIGNGNRSIRAMELIRSLYESKRCWLEMSANLRDAAMEKHRTLLSTPKPLSTTAANWIRRAVDVVVPPGTKYRPGRCVPTYSASYETTRRDGGNHGALTPDKSYPLGFKFEGDVISEELEKRCTKDCQVLGNDVEFQALPEPGKFRIITCGREKLYTSFRPFQRWLVGVWKNSGFGTMVDDFEKKILLKQKTDPNHLYFSGDYDSATDGLSLEATLCCITRILENIGEVSSFDDTCPHISDLAINLIRSFSGAVIHYPDGKNIIQTRGQLMGHPVSFPLLCIINLSTYMRATCCGGNTTRHEKLVMSRVLINGDDILFSGTIDLGNKWRMAAEDVGLTVNEMKTYVSPTYALINSIFCHMPRREVVRYIPLAASIGFNIKRGTLQENLGMIPQIWDLAVQAPVNKLYPLAGPDRTCMRILLKRIPTLLPKDYSGRFTPNYFIHRDLGGLGLEAPSDWHYEITGDQRKVAHYFHNHPEEVAISEKIAVQPTSVELALKKFRVIRAPVKRWILEGRPLHGPLREWEDGDLLNDNLLIKCLSSTAWVKGAPGEMDRTVRSLFRKAARNQSYMAISDIKAYRKARMILDFKLETEIPEERWEIGDNFFTDDEKSDAWNEIKQSF